MEPARGTARRDQPAAAGLDLPIQVDYEVRGAGQPHREHCGPSTRWATVRGIPGAFTEPCGRPDGNSLAVATTNFKRSGGSRVFAIDLATGARRTWFAIRTTHHFPGACRSSCISDEVVADLAGWWPQARIGFWVFSSGMTANEDGSPLEVVSAPGAKPTKLGTTLSDGTDTAVAASATGALAIVHAAWRDIGSGGTECRPCAPGATRCAPVPGASIWNAAPSFSCHPRSTPIATRPRSWARQQRRHA